MAYAKKCRIIGAKSKSKHESQTASSRTSITMIRCGCPAPDPIDCSGPTFFLLKGKECRKDFDADFLHKNGAAMNSNIVMTENAFLTDEAWKEICPQLIAGIRHNVRRAESRFNIDESTVDELQVLCSLEGFKSHTKNLRELINFATANVSVLVEERDSSHINQAFDKFVISLTMMYYNILCTHYTITLHYMQARGGKETTSKTLELLRGSHVTPIIDQYDLVLVGLTMLHNCSVNPLWESSFVAVNMHPKHRMGIEDWLVKIKADVKAADRFEIEHADNVGGVLPPLWLKTPENLRSQWIKIIDDSEIKWGVDMIMKLRANKMPVAIVNIIYKVYMLVKKLTVKDSSVASVDNVVDDSSLTSVDNVVKNS